MMVIAIINTINLLENDAMNAVNTIEASDMSANLLDKAKAGPVAIKKNGCIAAYIISAKLFARIEDAYWAEEADKAVANGDWLSTEESEKLLDDILNAKG